MHLPLCYPEGYLNDYKKYCISFNKEATDEILAAKPTTVVMMSTKTGTTAAEEKY